MRDIPFRFNATPWMHNGPAAWTFVTLPKDLSVEIRHSFQSEEQGWGRLKLKAQIGGSVWNTAIWFDTKYESYVLPLKAEIRKREKINMDTELAILLWI